MGIFNLRQRRRRDYSERRSDNSMVPRYISPPTRNTAEWVDTFGENPRVAVIDKVSSDLAYVKGKLYRIDQNGDKKELTVHPFLDFWARPNPLYEFIASALRKLQSNYLLLKGEGYFIIERYDNGYPAELWPVPIHWVQMTSYQDLPYYRIRTADGGVMDVPIDDVFVMKDLNPFDPYRRGLGQVKPLADEVEIDECTAEFQKKFFFNDAMPGAIVVMPEADDKQQERFLAKWKERFRGHQNSHGIATIGGPKDTQASVVKLSDNMKDLDMISGKAFTRDAILEHLGVPREIMGITQNSSRATAEATRHIYVTNVLTPHLANRQDAVSLQLLSAYGDDLIWEYDDIIPKDKEFEKMVAFDGWDNGVITKNEAREKLDMEKTEKSDIFEMNFADLYIGEDEDPVEPGSATEDLQYSDAPDPIEADRNDIEVPLGDELIESIQDEEKILRRAAEIKEQRIKAAGMGLNHARQTQIRKFEMTTTKYFRSQADQIQGALIGNKKAEGSAWDAIGMT